MAALRRLDLGRIAIVAVLGLLWFHYYGGFAAWFSQATGGPAQHVEKSDR